MIDPAVLFPNALVGHRRDRGNATFIQEVDGSALSYAETVDRASRWAALFLDLGVRPGDRILTMVPPSVDAVCSWVGAAWSGAVEASVNVDYVGMMLRYSLEYTGARIAVVTSAAVPRLDEVAAGTALETIIVVDETPATSSLRTIHAKREVPRIQPLADVPEVKQSDISCLLMTSGTTGPSKGVRIPWGQIYAGSVDMLDPTPLGPGQAIYSALPLYHIIARLNVQAAANAAGRVVTRERASLACFWDDIRKYDCVFSQVFGAALYQVPPQAGDRDNPLQVALMVPLFPSYREFADRFDVEVRTGFGLTEVGIALKSGAKIIDDRSCGQRLDGVGGFQVRLVDDDDMPVPDGTPGELIIRSNEPWTLNAGYFEMPEVTATAWRNGWFHTGDVFVEDKTGSFRFVDRKKDTIRRRAENISSIEVEREVLAHPDVLECAAVAAPADLVEDEIKIVVVRRENTELLPEALMSFLSDRMPRFMVPRYIEFVEALPRSEGVPKVRKVELRENPLNTNTWDRLTGTHITPSPHNRG